MLRCILAVAPRALALLMLAAADVLAGQRSFVSGAGADVGTCPPTAPCRSLGYAIAHTSPSGEVIVLDSAGYGPVTITQSISITAPPGIYAGISVFSGNGVTINAPGATVVLRGLSITGQGGTHGILAVDASRVHVENCVISHMNGIGIYHTMPNGAMFVLDTIVRDNADGVGLVAKDASIQLDHVRSEHNQNGGFYIAPVPGSTSANATITDSIFSANGVNGIWVDTVSAAVTSTHVERSVMNDNGHDGVYATSGVGYAYVTLAHNAIGTNGYDAVELLAPTGRVTAIMSENVLEYPGNVDASGPGVFVYASANTLYTITCVGGGGLATIYSFANNATSGGYPTCTVTKLAGS
jgi:hypothetical protein